MFKKIGDVLFGLEDLTDDDFEPIKKMLQEATAQILREQGATYAVQCMAELIEESTITDTELERVQGFLSIEEPDLSKKIAELRVVLKRMRTYDADKS